jgi:hypothetical protein
MTGEVPVHMSGAVPLLEGTALDLLVDHRAVIRVEPLDVIPRAAKRAAKQQSLAFIFDDDLGLLPFCATRLVSTGKHVASLTELVGQAPLPCAARMDVAVGL